MTSHDVDIATKAMGGRGFAVYSMTVIRPDWGRDFVCSECWRRNYRVSPAPVAVVEFDPVTDRLRWAVKVRRRRRWHGTDAGQVRDLSDSPDRGHRTVWVELGRESDPFETKCNNGHTVTVGPDDVIAAYKFAAREGIDGPIPLAAA